MTCYELIFSPTGGTRRAAELLGHAWPWERRTIDLCDAGLDFSRFSFAPEDLCLVAVPSFGGRVPVTAVERLGRLTGGGARAVLLCAYGNRAFDDTLLELADVLTASGFRCAAAVAAVAEHSIARQFAAGRPDDEDARQLAAFGAQIAAALDGGAAGPVQVPGHKPYRAWKGGPAPQANQACTACGLCAEGCPVRAIDPAQPHKTDKTRCIACMRCVSVCPQHARGLNPVLLFGLEKMLKKECARRKENELFL